MKSKVDKAPHSTASGELQQTEPTTQQDHQSTSESSEAAAPNSSQAAQDTGKTGGTELSNQGASVPRVVQSRPIHLDEEIEEAPLDDDSTPINGLEDALYYSDDSESFSDAYFHPNPTDGSKWYGSMENYRSPGRPSYEPNQPSILEDSPLTQSSALLPSTPTYGTPGTNRMRRKRRMRKGSRRLLQQEREREVTRIRGEVQSPAYHGIPWTILFFIQLLFVFSCAVHYGLTLLKPANVPLKSRRLSSSHFVDNLILQAGNQDVNDTKITQAIENSNITILHNKDMKNLQDDDFILSETSPSGTANVLAANPSLPTKQTQVGGSAADPTPGNPVLFRIDYRNVISIFSVSGLYGCVISYLSFGVMLGVSRVVIPIILIFSMLFAFFWTMFGLALFPQSASTLFGIVGLFLTLGYSMVSWNRIPFCSINLYTAMCALRDTRGVLFIAIGSLIVAFSWLLTWLIALIGIFNTSNAKECQQNTVDCRTHLVLEEDRYMELAVLLFSLFWTSLVIKNVVRTTIAGACGAWWFGLHEQSLGWACFNSIIWSQLAQSSSYSFGSICFGSLVEIPVQIISLLGGILCSCSSRSSDHHSEETTSNQEEDAHRSLNAVLAWEQEKNRNIFKRFSHGLRCCNRWCYTYMGMFSYSYLEGGDKAYRLFSTRGWMVIAEDNLIPNSLIMASIVIGASCGIFAVLVEEVDGYTFTSLHQPIWTAFWIGSVTGFTLSNILLLGVVGSAINTTLVCFAAEPFEFDKNHPRLSTEMRQVWSALVWEAPPPETSSSSLLNSGSETA